MRPEFQDIVDEVSRLLGRPVTLEDRNFNLVAFGSHDSQVDDVRLRSILQRHSTREVQDWFENFGIATSDVPVRTPTSDDLGVVSRLCLPVRWNGVTYGYLWLLDGDAGIDEARVPDAMVLADRAGALMAQQARSREELQFTVKDLLSADPEAVERAASEIHDLGIIGRDEPVAAIELRLVTPGPAQLVPMNLWRLPRIGPGGKRRRAQHPPCPARHQWSRARPRRRPAGVGAVCGAPADGREGRARRRDRRHPPEPLPGAGQLARGAARHPSR